jgi:hypothetical protein
MKVPLSGLWVGLAVLLSTVVVGCAKTTPADPSPSLREPVIHFAVDATELELTGFTDLLASG